MCVASRKFARMLACDSMEYASGSITLLNLMFTILRPLRVQSALVVHTTKHGYVNGVEPLLQSMRPWQWSQSNCVSTIL